MTLETSADKPVTSVHNNTQNPFESFWMGGFECTDQLNTFGSRVDFLHLTGHYALLDEDYQRLAPFNIRTVREGIRWSFVEKTPYTYDWTVVKHMIERGRATGIQQVWDICHFGFPDDLTPLHPLFSRRMTALCCAFVEFYRSMEPDRPLIVTPINEVSFLSWLGGDARGTSPYCIFQGWEVKYHLMKAYIESVAAMRKLDPSIRIMTTEPLVQIVPPLNATEREITDASNAHQNQYQMLDMLSGRMCPELGGSPDYLDILGYNYYYNNQWVLGLNDFLPWVNVGNDPRWRSLSSLLKEAYMRYERPIALTETSHSGLDRPQWIKYVAEETSTLLEQGIPLWGICLYPIIDRPDWDHLQPWFNSGLWDAEIFTEGKPPGRILYQPYADALLAAQSQITQSIEKARLAKKQSEAVETYNTEARNEQAEYLLSGTV